MRKYHIATHVFTAVALLVFILAIVITFRDTKQPTQVTPEEFLTWTAELKKRVDNYTESEAGQKELECWEKVQNDDKEGFEKCMEEWRKLRDEWWEKNKERFPRMK